ncbi:unnamed protein product, partial [marine sediment metagenome]
IILKLNTIWNVYRLDLFTDIYIIVKKKKLNLITIHMI